MNWENATPHVWHDTPLIERVRYTAIQQGPHFAKTYVGAGAEAANCAMAGGAPPACCGHAGPAVPSALTPGPGAVLHMAQPQAPLHGGFQPPFPRRLPPLGTVQCAGNALIVIDVSNVLQYVRRDSPCLLRPILTVRIAH